jgi:hypothetical protein
MSENMSNSILKNLSNIVLNFELSADAITKDSAVVLPESFRFRLLF